MSSKGWAKRPIGLISNVASEIGLEVKRDIVLCCMVLLGLFPSDLVFGADYFGYIDHGGTPQHVYQGCSSTCWAAAGAEILYWANYAVPAYTTAEEIYHDIISHDYTQHAPSDVWAWYLNGTTPGGNNWPMVQASDVIHYSGYPYTPLELAVSSLKEGGGVALVLGSSHGTVHVVAMWGFRYDASIADLTGIYITDSVLVSPSLIYLPLEEVHGSGTYRYYRIPGHSGYWLGGGDIVNIYSSYTLDKNPAVAPAPSIAPPSRFGVVY